MPSSEFKPIRSVLPTGADNLKRFLSDVPD